MSNFLTLEKYISRYDTGLCKRWTDFYNMMDIYLDFLSYVFPVCPLGIFSLGSCMLEIWLDTSARIKQLRLLSIDSTGQA